MRFFLVVLLILVGVSELGATPPQKNTVKDLLECNSKFWASISQIDLVYTRKANLLLVVNDKKIKNDAVDFDHWFCSDACEQLITKESVLGNKQDAVPETRCLFDGRRNWRWTVAPEKASFRPISVRDAIVNNCRITLNSIDKEPDFLTPKREFLGQVFRVWERPSEILSLSKYLDTFEIVSEPVRSVDGNGDVLWTFRLSTPDEAEREPSYTELTFNETRGFFLHRIYAFLSPSRSNAVNTKTGEKLPIVSERIVQEYLKLPQGIYFPQRIAGGFGQPEHRDQPGFYNTYYEIEKVLINEQVTEEICFTIPEHFIVSRLDLVDSSRLKPGEAFFAPISIWGKDNEAAMTFHTQEEYETFVAKTMDRERAALTPARFSTGRLVMIGLGAAFILLGLFLKVRERNQAEASC